MDHDLASAGALRATVSRPREARLFVTGALADQCDQAIETAELLVSELVTNAIRHAGAQRVDVTVDVRDGHAVLAVFDSSPDLPQPRQVSPTEEGGRGLQLVAHLAHRWGVEPTDRGKNIWVELPCGGHDAS